MNTSEALQTAFARPLKDKQVPTLSQLYAWLEDDQTNAIQYSSDFVCSEYAAMLVLQARTKRWQMGWVNVYGFDTSTHEEWNHAINSIVTTEGLVYVEPQNDRVWWYSEHTEMQSGKDYEMPHYDPPHTIHVNKVETVVSY